MRISVLLFILLLSKWSVLSQQTIKLWDQPFIPKKMKQVEMLAFQAVNNNHNVGIIICPGGSYCYLGIKKEGVQVANWLQQNGITAFVLQYRTSMRNNHHPAMIQDLQRAIQYLKENHAVYQIDTCKIGVMGFSAGGHLASTSATYFQKNFMQDLGIEARVSLRPDFVAMIYPVVSMTDSLAHIRSRRNLLGKHSTFEQQQMMSLELNVHDNMPPVFLIHCTKDKTVDYRNSVYYHKALIRYDIPCDFTLYDEKGHGFGIDPQSSHAPSWINNFIPWLQKINIIHE